MTTTSFSKGSVNLFLKDNILFNKSVVLVLFFCVFSQLASSQDKIKAKEIFLEAESYFLYEEYTEALPLFIKLKDQFPDNFNLDYRIGRCYINLPYEKQKSVEFLEEAANHISLTYKEGNFKELNAPLDVLYYLGDAYRVNNQLDKAIKNYKLFRSKIDDKIYDVALVDDQIKACERAIIAEKVPIDADENNLGEIFNTRFSDTNPVISANEDILVYTSKLPFYQAVYFSIKTDGKWSSPVNIIPDLGVDGDCFPTSISSDGKELFLYRSNEFKGDLYVSNFVNGKWTKIRRLNDNINTKYWESHASISADGKTLYFTSNRKEGFGGLDIYKSTRSSGDNWGPPVNLGPVVNSPYNEETPFISFDGKRLFFSSFGHKTIGGYDVFYSTLKNDGSWAEPINFGYPINTPDDDLFFNPLRDGTIAYTAKFDNQGLGRFDLIKYHIYSEKNPRTFVVKGSLKIPYSWSEFSGVRLTVYDKNRRDTILTRNITTEQFSFEALKGNYEVRVQGPGLKTELLALTLPPPSKNKEILLQLAMRLMPAQIVLANSQNANVPDVGSVTNDLQKTDQTPAQPKLSNTKTELEKNIENKAVNHLPVPEVKPVGTKTTKQCPLLFRPYTVISGLAALAIIFLIFFIKRRTKDKQQNT